VAQDAAQDTFVNALRGLDRFRGESSFRTWLLRIALNTSNTIGRRRTRRREVTLDAAASQPATGADVSETVAAQRDGERLGALLQHLPTKQRLAVTLRIQSGLSYAQIGEAIDCSEGSARVNYHLGIKRLKELAGL
jgi:RNA polymerase sigma-70 factor (ECF subfamily)